MEHFESIAGTTLNATYRFDPGRARTQDCMCTSRSAGKEIDIRTWMKNTRRVGSLRKYEFVRKSDGEILVKGKTDWVFVDAKTGAPRALPEEV